MQDQLLSTEEILKSYKLFFCIAKLCMADSPIHSNTRAPSFSAYTVFGNVPYHRWEAVDVPSAWDAGERAHFLMQLRWYTWKQLWQLQTGAMTWITSQQTIHSYFSSVSCSIRQPIHTHTHTHTHTQLTKCLQKHATKRDRNNIKKCVHCWLSYRVKSNRCKWQ